MEDNKTEALPDEMNGDGLRRRAVLKRTGALGATGFVGASIGITPAAASHCIGPDDDQYLQEVTDDNQTQKNGDCGTVKLSSSTTLSHMDVISHDNSTTHTFYFSTIAGSEFVYSNADPEKADAITYHTVDLESSDVSGSVLDFCQPKTGAYPSGGSDEVDENWETLADIAISAITGTLGSIAFSTLKSVIAITELLTYVETSSTHQVFEMDRTSLSADPYHKTKVQGTFEVNVPDGSQGYVEVRSETEADGNAATAVICSGPNIIQDEEFWIYVDGTTANLFPYDPRL